MIYLPLPMLFERRQNLNLMFGQNQLLQMNTPTEAICE
jgi:hypothetical protein